MLSLLLFSIFCAAVLTVVLHQRFSEDTVILAELVHLKEPPTSMGPEPAVDYVRRAVWGMLYADDACIVSRSPQGLAKIVEVVVEVCRAFMEVIVEVCQAFTLNVSAKKTETMCMPPPHGCSTGTLRQEHYAKLRTVHHRVFLRIIGAQRKRPDCRMALYDCALEITRCDSIATNVAHERRRLWAGALIRISGGRLPKKRIVFTNHEDAVQRGRGGKEKEWADCLQSVIRPFGIAED